jgi:hypothetical protein
MQALLLLTLALGPAAEPKVEIVEVRKIWDKAPHNAFTDLIRFKDQWYCTFREGKDHNSPDGAIRVLTSTTGSVWESAALLSSDREDLRDSKLSVTPSGQLMLIAAGALHKPMEYAHQTYTWFTEDGRNWGKPTEVGDPNYWLWRVQWHKKVGYGIGYECGKVQDARLYRTTDGKKFEHVVAPLFREGYPNESSLVFLEDDSCLCLLRRDGKSATAQLGHAKPPYTDWKWTDLGVRIGGPHMLQLPNGQILAVVRLYDKKVRTSICALDPKAGKLTELTALPSGGDTSYAGMVWHDNLLWISYYASHEGKTSIYLAKVKVTD